ncbi:hypothetical protein FCM35_KLT16691 [Carex littledalei]|uniref:Uncharacterized protein n=1 Tax=Carex littledalei TaxID=544730 RepID=A0A833R6Q8_9POAL|nr:hypothetical protein FCM35_KLT16691 [Carex littledalei]
MLGALAWQVNHSNKEVLLFLREIAWGNFLYRVPDCYTTFFINCVDDGFLAIESLLNYYFKLGPLQTKEKTSFELLLGRRLILYCLDKMDSVVKGNISPPYILVVLMRYLKGSSICLILDNVLIVRKAQAVPDPTLSTVNLLRVKLGSQYSYAGNERQRMTNKKLAAGCFIFTWMTSKGSRYGLHWWWFIYSEGLELCQNRNLVLCVICGVLVWSLGVDINAYVKFYQKGKQVQHASRHLANNICSSLFCDRGVNKRSLHYPLILGEDGDLHLDY